MANSFRVDRVGMEIKREVNEILQKKVRDPRVQNVTITDVQMLGDLSMAKVFYTVMSDLASDNEKAQIGLEKATGTIKRELGKNLSMYKIPDLTLSRMRLSLTAIRLTRCCVIWTLWSVKNQFDLSNWFFDDLLGRKCDHLGNLINM